MNEANALDEHRWLQQLLGDWTSSMDCGADPEAPPMTGTEHVRSLGDLWVLCEGTGPMPGGGEALMLMTLGYDPAQKVFTGTWVGSMMTHLWVYRGTLDGARKVLTLESEGPSFSGDGTMGRYRDVITLVSAEERTLTSFSLQADGSWKQFMQCTYRRTAR